MSNAFNDAKADFSGIAEKEGLYISAAIHKAFIKVDESGTEAAASTAIKMFPLCERRSTPFVVDHPFLYLIKENRNELIFFIGAVVDPLH